MEENRIVEEINLDEFNPGEKSDDLDISFENTDEQNGESKERETISLDDEDETEEKPSESEPDATEEEENTDEEDDASVSGPNEKGMTEADYKKWAQDYNCTEEEVMEALDMGWHGPKGFSKDKTFLTPTEFLEKSKKNAPIMYQRWKQTNEQFAEFRKTQKMMQDSIIEINRRNVQQALADKQKVIDELTAKLKSAKEDFDVDEIEKLALEKHKLEQEKESMEKKEETPKANPNPNINFTLEKDWIENSETAQIIKSDPMALVRYSEVVRVLDNDSRYRGWTSEQRIAYIEREFGRKSVSKPAATPVGKGTSGAVSNSKDITWDSVPNDFKNLSLELAKDLPWWSTRNTNEESKKAFDAYKKDIINAYKKGV